MATFLNLLKNILQALFSKDFWIEPPPPPPPPSQPRSLLNEFCLAIQKFEGYFEGSRSFRNHNPGNIRCVSRLYFGAVGRDSGGFCIFATYADGFNALKSLVYNAANGESKIYKPDMSIVSFCKVYAPSADGNHPEKYATYLGKALGVNPFTFQIKDLL